jgi:hypothetical protein
VYGTAHVIKSRVGYQGYHTTSEKRPDVPRDKKIPGNKRLAKLAADLWRQKSTLEATDLQTHDLVDEGKLFLKQKVLAKLPLWLCPLLPLRAD